MFTKTAAVVEIGASHVAFGQFQAAPAGRLRLRDCAVEQIGSDAIFEPAWLEKAALALRALRGRSGYSGEITLVLPPHLTLTKFVKTPRLGNAQRQRVIQFEAQQALPLALSDLVWDSAIAGEQERETTMMISAVKRENIEAVCAAVDSVDLVPRRIVSPMLPLLAGYRRANATDSPPTLLFDIGARSVVMLLVEPHRFCGRCFALGGPAAIDQLTMEVLALRLKQEATRSLVHFGQHVAATRPVRVVVTGGGAQVPGLAESLAAKFQLPIHRLDASGLLDASGAAALPVPVPLQLAGAAAMELIPGQPVMDLRPTLLRERETSRRRRPWLVATGAVAALAVVPPMLHYRELAAVAATQTAAIERELVPWRAREAVIRSHLQRIDEAKRRVAELQRFREARSGWLRLLADLQGRLQEVEDVWIERVQVLPAAKTESGSSMQLALTGRMLDRANPLSKVSDETRQRVRRLLAGIAGSPFVASVEVDRLDPGRPGLLGFDFVVVARADALPGGL